MNKKPRKPKGIFRPDPERRHPPIDKRPKLPDQVQRAAAVADALSTGQPIPDTPQPKRTRGKRKITLADGAIDDALQYLNRGDLKAADPQFATIIELAREGARTIRQRRDNARKPRKNSDGVTRRLETLLSAFQELPEKRRKNATGTETIRLLRELVIKKLRLRDGDVSEDTILHDLRLVRPLIRRIQDGAKISPRPDEQPNQQEVIRKTALEIEAGRKAVMRASAKLRRRPARRRDQPR